MLPVVVYARESGCGISCDSFLATIKLGGLCCVLFLKLLDTRVQAPIMSKVRRDKFEGMTASADKPNDYALVPPCISPLYEE